MAQILIIDDDTQLLQAMEIAFRKSRHNLKTACDGKKGLACMAQFPAIDVVITDIIMPELDGIEVIATLNKQPCRPVIIAMSGGSQRLDLNLLLQTAKMMKVDLVLPKPITPMELLEAIETLLLTRQTNCSMNLL
jgi:CheY-like chemotaxis protein